MILYRRRTRRRPHEQVLILLANLPAVEDEYVGDQTAVAAQGSGAAPFPLASVALLAQSLERQHRAVRHDRIAGGD